MPTTLLLAPHIFRPSYVPVWWRGADIFAPGPFGFVGPKLLRNELPLDKWVKDMEEKEKPCLEVNDMTIRDHS